MRPARTDHALGYCLAIALCGASAHAEILEDFDLTFTMTEATGPSSENPVVIDDTTTLFCLGSDDVVGSTEVAITRVELAGDLLTVSFLDGGPSPELWFETVSRDIGTQTIVNTDGTERVVHRRFFDFSRTETLPIMDGFASTATEVVRGVYREDFFPAFQGTFTEHRTTTLTSNGASVDCTLRYRLRGGGTEVDIAPDDSGWINDASSIIRDWVIDENESQNFNNGFTTVTLGVRG